MIHISSIYDQVPHHTLQATHRRGQVHPSKMTPARNVDGAGGGGGGGTITPASHSHTGHDDGRTLAGVHESITELSGGNYVVNMLSILPGPGCGLVTIVTICVHGCKVNKTSKL